MSSARRTSSRFSVLERVSFLCLLALIAASCAAPKRQTTRVRVIAESDPGKALADVRIIHDGVAIGASDAAGDLPLALTGRLGDLVTLQVQCPEGYRPIEPHLQVVLRPLEPGRTPQYRAACRPERRWLVVSVRAKNAVDVPLRYLDREIGRTDRDGVAHGVVALAPGERAKFVLDTSDPRHRYLRPQNPVLQFNMPDRDEVASLEQPFIVDAPKKAPPPPELLPQRF